MKKIYTSVLCALLAPLSFGQTLQGSDLNATIGETIDINMSSYTPPGSAGTGQTWDLSSVSTTSSSTVSHTAANPGFPSTNITQSATGGTSIYFDFASTGQHMHGVDAGGTIITYSDAMTFVGFPLSMSTTGNDTHMATFTSGGFPFTRAGTTSWEVDGTGTLITPNGTYTNCLRVKIIQDYSDTWSGPQIDYLVEIYAWFKAGIHYPVAEMNTLTTSSSGTQTYGLYVTGNVGLEDAPELTFTMYPNPATNEISVMQFNGNMNAMLISDMSGKILKEVNGYTADISDLESGVYFLTVVDAEGRTSEAQKFVKL